MSVRVELGRDYCYIDVITLVLRYYVLRTSVLIYKV